MKKSVYESGLKFLYSPWGIIFSFVFNLLLLVIAALELHAFLQKKEAGYIPLTAILAIISISGIIVTIRRIRKSKKGFAK